MTSIPASELVNAIPSVLAAGGNPLSLNAIFLTDDTTIPIGTVQPFATLADVQAWFGPASIQAELAAVYFNGYDNAQTLPGTLYFAQYNAAAVAAYLRSGSFQGFTLAQLQALSGTLVIVIDGETVTSANINLAAANSFTNAATLIQAGIQTPGGIFDGQGSIDDGAGGPGNTLTISVVTSGAVHVGDEVTGPGVAPGTTITAFLTGTGGLGTYTVSGAAQDVGPIAIQVSSTATVSYNAQLARFVISSPTTGAASTMAYATGTLSAGLRLTAATGATLSQGAAAATPNGAMTSFVGVTQNWATFMTTFEPDTDTKLEFAQWVQTTNDRYAYVAWDSDATILAGAAPASFGAQVVAANMNGIFPIYEPATDAGNGRKAAFVCGTAGSIDFDQPQGRLTFAYKGQAGLVADVTVATEANNLAANGYNFYAAYATANDRFVNLQHGSTPGAYKFFDSYINQVWLNSEIQLALMVFQTRVRSNPYNSVGYNNIRATVQDPAQRALFAGVIQPGITLSNAQKAIINTEAGANIADVLQTVGYYIQVLDASPEVRAVRGSPPITFWYTDGGSIQKIEIASIMVQ
jgi:hypothetical protein